MHPPLKTARMTLRPMTLTDAPDLVELNSDPEVVRFTGDGPFKDLDDAKALIRGYDLYETSATGRLICRLHDGTFLGFCGLKKAPETGEVDLGYRFMRRFWGQGLATEASLECLRYGFEDLGLDRIIARAMVENPASARVLIKLGFTDTQGYLEEGRPWRLYTLDRPRGDGPLP